MPVLAGIFVGALFMAFSLFALTQDTFHILVGSVIGGLALMGFFYKMYTVNIWKNHKQQAKKDWEDYVLDELEDKMAFTNAVYNKIHPSYKECIEQDYWMMVDKYEEQGFQPDMNRVETLFYQYLVDPQMTNYLHNAMAIYG